MYSGPDTLERVGFPIRTSADQRSLASPRGFSQRATSFIASWRQGIHRTPLSRSISHHHRPHAGPNRALHDKLCMPYQSLNPRPPDILPVAIYPTNPSSLVKEHTRPDPLSRSHARRRSFGNVHPTIRPCQTNPRQNRRQSQHQPIARSLTRCSRTGIPNPPREHPTASGEPAADGLEANGFEPMTPCLQSRCSTS
jgi:hypothetical protein